MEQHATARWEGGLLDGAGRISTESGELDQAPYRFKTRFGGQRGSNPEELIAAAHAGCFSMALAKELEDAGFRAETIETEAEVALEKQGEGFAITRSKLAVWAAVPGCPEDLFMRAAERAKAGCPVSKVLRASISLEARLVGGSQAAAAVRQLSGDGDQPAAGS